MEDIIVTYNGKSEKRKDCVFIRGKYYHKNNDCFFFNGIYYSPFSRYLVLDNETGKRIHKESKAMNFGVINHNDSTFNLGYYSSNISKNGFLYLPSELDKKDVDTILQQINEANDGNFTNKKISQRRTEETSPSYVRLSPEDPWNFVPSEREGEADIISTSDMRRRANTRVVAVDLRNYPISPEETEESRMKSKINLISVPCMDVVEFIKYGMKQCLNSDYLCTENDIKIYNKLYRPTFNSISAINPYSFPLNYNCEGLLELFTECNKNNKYPVSTKMDILSEHLYNFTYGIEYESWNGRIPTWETARCGLIPLRDGSLKHDGYQGYEYATIIMSGPTGLSMIKSQCEALSKYTIYNEKCSMHIHVGNIPKTPENLVRLYKAFYSIQSSIYALFPSCLMNTADYKQKNYCSPLPKLKFDKNDIVKFLSDGNELYDSFGKPHPRDRSMTNKWNINSRYHIVNFNNFYYTNRGTVELRISTPTFNKDKIVILLMIICEIINSALNDKCYTDVITLVKERFEGVELEWMLSYINYRISTLSQWNPKSNGIEYFENIKNDADTGSKEKLYN